MAGVTRGQGESAAYRQRVVTLLQWLEGKSIGSLQVPSSSCRPEQDYNCSYAPHLTRVKGALKVKSEGSPVVAERWRYRAKSHHGEMGCMAPLQLGRLRRPSTRREAGSRAHSSRATGASQKSAGCEGCVHQVCRPQIRSPEGTNASFASVGFTATRGWWMN